MGEASIAESAARPGKSIFCAEDVWIALIEHAMEVLGWSRSDFMLDTACREGPVLMKLRSVAPPGNL